MKSGPRSASWTTTAAPPWPLASEQGEGLYIAEDACAVPAIAEEVVAGLDTHLGCRPGGYAGYTGPRCYAPGGKSWKPC